MVSKTTPAVIAGASMVVTDAPVVIIGAQVVVIGASVVMTDVPVVVVGGPVVVIGASVVMVDAPVAMTDAPVVVFGGPAVALRRPLVTPGHGVVMAGRPGVPSVVTLPCALGRFRVQCAWKEAPMHPSRTPIVLLAALVLAASVPLPVASAQPAPLTEPFPWHFDLNSIDGRNGFRVEGFRETIDEAYLGSAVSRAGDVNSDGIADFLIATGALDSKEHLTEAGPSYVVFGRRGGVGGFPELLSTTELDGHNGFALAAPYGPAPMSTVGPAGDVNGDGVDDIIASSWSRDDGRVTYIVFGRDTATQGPFAPVIGPLDMDGESGFRVAFESMARAIGWAVRGIGDLNGDGIDDFAVGVPNEDVGGRRERGSTFVVFGRDASAGSAFPQELDLGALDGTDGFRFDGTQDWERSGQVIAPAGDLNGDGLDDMMIAAPNARPGGEPGGSVYVLFGRDAAAAGPFPARFSVAWIDTTNGFIISGDGEDLTIGQSVARAGDVNADGLDDVIIGAPGACPCRATHPWNTTGAALVVYGRDTAAAGRFPYRLRVSDLDGVIGFRLVGEDLGDQVGFTVGGGGDVTGDGVDDIVIGANRVDYRGHSYYGTTYVVFGRDSGRIGPFPETFQLSGLNGSNGFRAELGAHRDHARVGAIAGDVNSDGLDDVLIGAMRVPGTTHSHSGAAYTIYGRDLHVCPADLDGDGDLTIFDFLAFQNLFDAMDPAADFDGDGAFTFLDFLAFQNAFDAGCP